MKSNNNKKTFFMKKKKDFSAKNTSMIAMGDQVKKMEGPNTPPGWVLWKDVTWR